MTGMYSLILGSYRSPGSLYSSISIVAPPGDTRFHDTSSALQNLFGRMSSYSSMRPFSSFQQRSWTSSIEHGPSSELYLTNLLFTRRKDLIERKQLFEVLQHGPPLHMDSNGTIRSILDRRNDLCFARDNVILMKDVSNSHGAPDMVDS